MKYINPIVVYLGKGKYMEVYVRSIINIIFVAIYYSHSVRLTEKKILAEYP